MMHSVRWGLLALALLSSCGEGEPIPKPSSVLLISIDMLRADHVGCYGYERDTTPTIDALAGEGVRFAQQISSAPWTLPAHAALFTSLPGTLHGATDGAGTALSPEHQTLAEVYRRAGYATAGFHAGPLPARGLRARTGL